MTAKKKCKCHHLYDKHSFTMKGYSCTVKTCRCLDYKEDETDKIEFQRLSKQEKVRAVNERKGIRVVEGRSMRERIDDMVFETDIIRKEYDITMLPDDKLTWYQLVQKRRILEYRKQYDDKDSKT